MEKRTFPEWGLPMATRPKEEETEAWPGVAAPGVSPVATGATGAQHPPVADGGIARLAGVHRPQGARLPKYSGATPLEPYLAQFRIAALHYGWDGDESATQLALALEGSAVQVLMDLGPAAQRDLQALTRALDLRGSPLTTAGNCWQEGERLGAYAADVLLHAQRGYPAYPAAVREDLALHAFLRGLAPPRLGQHVRLTRPPTLGAALDEAERAEQELSDHPSLQPPGAPRPRVRQAVRCEPEEDGEEVCQAWTPTKRPRQRPPPPTDVPPEVTGAVSGAVNRAIWPDPAAYPAAPAARTLEGLCVGDVCLSTVLHSLKYFCTASSGVSNFPEFVAVVLVDELQIGYYDSNSQTAEPKQAWMDQFTRDYPKYQERETHRGLDAQQKYKVRIDDLKQRFNQTGGAHIYQVMTGCEWDDEDDTTDGYRQYGYDGEDFIVLDLKNLRWIAPTPQAFITKLSWDQNTARLQYLKNYYTKECVDWLKKFLAYGKSTLQRTERPEVSLLQRRPSSPVVCHATGFYPDRVVVFWRRDGEELYEHVDHGEVLPNPDGTFQVSVDLDLASVPREDWRRYECVFKLKGIEDILTPLDPALVRTNWGKTGPGGDGGRNTCLTTST
ncbi:Major histocompatibility complex class I-related gene protein [Merluccius polli]|uniref:Major histocompatibility complex class I-related gene protein n=1 Tax=Merluccius polli TaxID=89951 RepID=A0AA47MFK8_MERPO|nr:Major histocompatibility complex class I-related gene protein [Merluccius polli]